MNFNIIPAGTDLLGQLKDAELELACGPILKENFFKVSRLDPEEEYPHYDSEDDPDSEDLPNASDPPEIAEPPRNKGFYIYKYSKDFYDADEEFADCERLYLPILEKQVTELTYSGTLNIYGLVLKRADIRGKGYFSRIGVFDKSFMKKSYVELMESVCSYDDMLVEESGYHRVLEPDSKGIKQYSVRLI
jgi:hypothetical protein